MKKNSIRRIFCIYPVWLNNSGHEASYLDSLKFLSKKTFCKIFLILPKKNKNKLKGFDHEKILEHLSTGYISTIIKIKKNLENLKKLFKKKKLNEQDIIFIDGYSFDFLISLSIFLLLNKNKQGNLLIYCRYNFKNIKNLIFRIFVRLISNKFIKYKILTDTKELKLKLSKTYGSNKILLLPVPHTQLRFTANKKNLLKIYDLFFPGQYRLEKFGKNLFNFIKLNNKSSYRFIINNKFIWKSKRNFKLKRLITNLSQEDYFSYIKSSHLIVLPYDSRLYRYRTSGIFIESVVLKKPVLVSEGTWMANEYKKFNLNELVVKNWSKFDLKHNLKKIFNRQTKIKINSLQKNYKKIHNRYTYAKILEKIL